LVAGFFIGFFVANNINRNAAIQPDMPQINVPIQNQQTQVASVKEPSGAMMSDVTETLNQAKNQPENFEAQMKAGNLYMQIQNFEKAAAFYDTAAALKPTEYEKIVRLGNAFFDVRQYEKAEAFYQQALKIKSDDIDVRTDLGTALIQRADPDYDRAINELQTVLKSNPKHEPALYNIALAFHRKGDKENVQKYLARLEQANPNSPLVGRLKQILR
jgi:tetratricopeptide (TPR) repeat protein